MTAKAKRDQFNNEQRQFYSSILLDSDTILPCESCGVLLHTETGRLAGFVQALVTIQNSPRAVAAFSLISLA